MAFENVFGNIDWAAPQRNRNANRAYFADMLGKGIQQAQFAQQMDLKRRQMEADAQEVDLSKMAQVQLLNKANNLPYDQNVIDAYSALKGSQTYIDPRTQSVVTNPTLAERAAGLGGGMVGPQGQGTNPAVDKPYGEIQPTPLSFDEVESFMSNTQMAEAGYNPTSPAMGMSGAQAGAQDLYGAVPTYKAPKGLGVRGEIMEAESEQKAADTVTAEQIRKQMQGLERFNDANLEAANFANRMVQSRGIMEGLISEDRTAGEGMTGAAGVGKQVLDILPLGDFGSSLGAAAVHLNATPEQQQYLNAAENWLTANLRKESGAVIGADEMAKEYRKYFPMPGDSGALKEKKALLRKEAEKGMIGQSAGSYQEVFGVKSKSMQEQTQESVKKIRKRYNPATNKLEPVN